MSVAGCGGVGWAGGWAVAVQMVTYKGVRCAGPSCHGRDSSPFALSSPSASSASSSVVNAAR